MIIPERFVDYLLGSFDKSLKDAKVEATSKYELEPYGMKNNKYRITMNIFTDDGVEQVYTVKVKFKKFHFKNK